MKIIDSLKNSYLRGELIFAIDTLLSLAASLLAIFGVMGLVGASSFTARFLVLYLMVAVVGSVVLFVCFRTFRIIIRHLSVRDVIPFAQAAIGKSCLIMVALLIAGLFFSCCPGSRPFGITWKEGLCKLANTEGRCRTLRMRICPPSRAPAS